MIRGELFEFPGVISRDAEGADSAEAEIEGFFYGEGGEDGLELLARFVDESNALDI